MKKDLVVLVADKNMEFTMKAILNRRESIGTRTVNFDIFIHPQRDPGVYLRAHDFLSPFLNRYNYCIVVFDKEGCGVDKETQEIIRTLQNNLNSSGWLDKSAVICINPELETWMWIKSPHLANNLGWDLNELYEWLTDEGFLASDRIKPIKPKEAFKKALYLKNKPRSSSVYKKIALSVSFRRCEDISFKKLKETLGKWFPIN